MKHYFTLQQRRLERHLSEIGLHPIIGYVLGIVTFLLLSLFLFYKTVWAEYIYAFIALTFIFRFSATPRNDFLKLCFPGKGYYRLRILENILIALPFSAYLLYEGRYLTAFLLLIIATLLTRVEMEGKINVTIPTPFYQYPFEFIIGFRQYFLFMLLPYFLAFKAYEADNFNLGAFALGLMFLFSMAFYLKPENEYFVWIYSQKTRGFLIGKILNALLCSSFLTLPILLALCAWRTDQTGVLTGGVTAICPPPPI